MSEKVKIYRNLSAMVKDLKIFRTPESEISEIVRHEKAHYNKAVELGYKPQYCLVFSNIEQLKFRPSIRIAENKNLSDSDLKKILMAPKDPSDRDLRRLAYLEGLI